MRIERTIRSFDIVIAIVALLSSAICSAEDCDDFDSIHDLASNGSERAQYRLGVAYQFGRCTEFDINEAMYWYFLAAENGSIEAAYNLGLAFSTGGGMSINIRLAELFLTRASDAGHKEATAMLLNLAIDNFEDCESMTSIDANMDRLAGSSALDLVNKSKLKNLQALCAKSASGD